MIKKPLKNWRGEIVANIAYKEDYEKITKNLLFKPLPYETAISRIQLLINGHYFE